MAADQRFRRNVALIALGHVLVIGGLVTWALRADQPKAVEKVEWMDPGTFSLRVGGRGGPHGGKFRQHGPHPTAVRRTQIGFRRGKHARARRGRSVCHDPPGHSHSDPPRLPRPQRRLPLRGQPPNRPRRPPQPQSRLPRPNRRPPRLRNLLPSLPRNRRPPRPPKPKPKPTPSPTPKPKKAKESPSPNPEKEKKKSDDEDDDKPTPKPGASRQPKAPVAAKASPSPGAKPDASKKKSESAKPAHVDTPAEASAKAAALAAGVNAGGGGGEGDGSSDEGGFHGHGSGKGSGSSPGNGSGNGNGKGGGGGSSDAGVGWYTDMIQSRFYSEWDRPSIKGGEAATVKIRVEKDGRISKVSLSHSSDKPEIDDSAMAAAGRVKQIEAPPASLTKAKGYYEVNVRFELTD